MISKGIWLLLFVCVHTQCTSQASDHSASDINNSGANDTTPLPFSDPDTRQDDDALPQMHSNYVLTLAVLCGVVSLLFLSGTACFALARTRPDIRSIDRLDRSMRDASRSQHVFTTLVEFQQSSNRASPFNNDAVSAAASPVASANKSNKDVNFEDENVSECDNSSLAAPLITQSSVMMIGPPSSVVVSPHGDNNGRRCTPVMLMDDTNHPGSSIEMKEQQQRSDAAAAPSSTRGSTAAKSARSPLPSESFVTSRGGSQRNFAKNRENSNENIFQQQTYLPVNEGISHDSHNVFHDDDVSLNNTIQDEKRVALGKNLFDMV